MTLRTVFFDVRPIVLLLALLTVPALFLQPATSEAQSTAVRIMPLGDSITTHSTTYNSYRRPLWHTLQGAAYNVDFTGSRQRNDHNHLPPNPDFDLDFEGHPGWRVDNILPNLRAWADAQRPDIVLVHLGTNDLIQGQSVASTVAELGQLIDILRASNSSVTILLAQITPTSRSINNLIPALNSEIAALAASKNTTQSRVILVDQHTGFNVATDTSDGTHPNVSGEQKMADRWYQALRTVLPGSGTTPPTSVPPTPIPVGGGTGLSGQYFDEKDLTAFKLARTDATIHFNWGTGSPAGGIGADTFSARWTGTIVPRYSQTYTFHTFSDDGVRLLVNGQLIVNNWTDHSPTENSGQIALQAGQHYSIQLEYYENGVGAVMTLSWSSASQSKEIVPQSQLFPAGGTTPPTSAPPTPVPPTPVPGGSGTGLSGQYYDNMDLTNLKLARTDATVNFNWGNGSPWSGIGADTFSARWTGTIVPLYSQTYTFTTYSDDGVRLWVNGQLIVNNWTDHPPTENSGTIALQAGQHYDIKLEYYENGVGAVITLSWSSASQPKQIVPQSQLFPAGGTTPPTSAPPTPVPPTPVPGGGGTGLSAEYYDNMDLSNHKLTRTDPLIDFYWGGSPAAGVDGESFSIRWSGGIVPLYSQTYTFTTISDDGVRLWVNGQLVIDNWTNHAPTEDSGQIALQAGQRYDLVLEYYDWIYGANIRLFWSSASQPRQIVPQSQLIPAADTISALAMESMAIAAPPTPVPTLDEAGPIISDPDAVTVSYSACDAAADGGGVYTDGGVLPLGFSPGGRWTTGLRFCDVDIPPGSTILSARLAVTAADSGSSPLVVEVGFEDSGSSRGFEQRQAPSGRPSIMGVAWDISGWEQGAMARTPELAALLARVIGRADWQAGNDLTMLISGTNGSAYRLAEAREPALVPQLSVVFVPVDDAMEPDAPTIEAAPTLVESATLTPSPSPTLSMPTAEPTVTPTADMAVPTEGPTGTPTTEDASPSETPQPSPTEVTPTPTAVPPTDLPVEPPTTTPAASDSDTNAGATEPERTEVVEPDA